MMLTLRISVWGNGIVGGTYANYLEENHIVVFQGGNDTDSFHQQTALRPGVQRSNGSQYKEDIPSQVKGLRQSDASLFD